MAYNPVSGAAVQYSKDNGEVASGYWLKFYIANTTTPLSMAVDSTGASLLVKCKLNDKGYPISNELDNKTVFIPHVNQAYRFVLYVNETDADNNTTANADVNIPKVSSLLSTDDGVITPFDSIADLPTVVIGNRVSVTGYHAGTTVGGGDAVGVVGRHDGVINFDPTRSAEIGTAAYYVDSGIDVVCWARSLSKEINVLDAGAIGDNITDDLDAIQNARTIAKSLTAKLVIPQGNYKTTGTVDLRDVLIDAQDCYIISHHIGIGVILGGSSTNPNNPRQDFGAVLRDGAYADGNPNVRIIGARSQQVKIQYALYIQLYADSDTSEGGASYTISYSDFDFKYTDKLELTNNLSTDQPGVDQWINENKFRLRVCQTLRIDGNYSHNHNIFDGGNFEAGSGVVDFQVGMCNQLRNIRGEGGLSSIYFGPDTEGNLITASWWSSGIRVFDPVLQASINDNGRFNVVTTEQAIASQLHYLGGFSWQTLKQNNVLDYNFKGVSNVNIGATAFSVPVNDFFYESDLITISEYNALFSAVVDSVSTGGIRIYVDGYDATQTIIASTGSDWFAGDSGGGALGWGDSNVTINNSVGDTNFYITSTAAKYIKVRIRAGGLGLVAESMTLGVRIRDKSPENLIVLSGAFAPNISDV